MNPQPLRCSFVKNEHRQQLWVSTTRHLARISAHTGRKSKWDTAAHDVAGDKEASAMRQRPNRSPA